MAVKVTYENIMKRVLSELSVSLTTDEDFTKFKRKMSQAKFRMGVEGKLIFSHSESEAMVNGVKIPVNVVTIVLEHKRDKVNVINLNEDL